MTKQEKARVNELQTIERRLLHIYTLCLEMKVNKANLYWKRFKKIKTWFTLEKFKLEFKNSE